MIGCPKCSRQFSGSNGLVTHLSNQHSLSRIEARKIVVQARTDKSKNTVTNSPEANVVCKETDSIPPDISRREWMLKQYKNLYKNLGYLPYQADIDKLEHYSEEDYVDEFGSVMGAAVLAGVSSIEPEEYNHEADGSKQYSEWELINGIWRLYELTGRPSSRMMDQYGDFSLQAYQYRFGSWSAALEEAHINGPSPSIPSKRDPKNRHYASSRWQQLRKKALERDSYQCQRCGMDEEAHQEQFGVGLNVHHIEDVAEFEEPEEADSIDNLESLCAPCHGKEHPFASD